VRSYPFIFNTLTLISLFKHPLLGPLPQAGAHHKWEHRGGRPWYDTQQAADVYLIKDDHGMVHSTFARVGKGRFLLYNEGEPTEHTPKEMWSHATPRYQVMLAKAGDTKEGDDDVASVRTTAWALWTMVVVEKEY